MGQIRDFTEGLASDKSTSKSTKIDLDSPSRPLKWPFWGFYGLKSKFGCSKKEVTEARSLIKNRRVRKKPIDGIVSALERKCRHILQGPFLLSLCMQKERKNPQKNLPLFPGFRIYRFFCSEKLQSCLSKWRWDDFYYSIDMEIMRSQEKFELRKIFVDFFL